MSGESSKRSSLVDLTFQQLHSLLSGQLEGTTPDQLAQTLDPRAEQLRNIREPFGKPSDASKKKVESGSATLPDGVILKVDDTSKEFILAISDKFQIDQIQALILLRSFLYNQGLPTHAGSETDASLVEEFVEAITPFYYAEKLFLLRSLIPLYRAKEDINSPVHQIANDYLPKIVPDGPAFVNGILSEYQRKTREELPANLLDDPKAVARWAKQNLKEQLVLMEVLFWTVWSFVPCDGSLVVDIYTAAYATSLGRAQQNVTLILDAEGAQLQQDIAALWIVVTIEVLQLERIAEPDGIEISAEPGDNGIYTASPESLIKIHELVTSNSNSQYACTYLAWAFVISRLTTLAQAANEIPNAYRSFFDSLSTHAGRTHHKEREPVHVLMSRLCMSPDAGLFQLILGLLTESPLFVTAVAWKNGSTVTDPNAIAFRSVLKGLVIALVELIPIEQIPDFDSLVEAWIALFGRSESQVVAPLCRQFWQSDWRQGIARRAIFDVARSRFPVQFRPLVRLLRAMTASGFLDTDPLSTADHSHEGQSLTEDRDLCDRYVFHYFNRLSTYTQVIHATRCAGAFAWYERIQERYGSSSPANGVMYTNIAAMKLPGGSMLPPKSTGRLFSGDGAELMAVSWQHEHSGWKLVLELLTDYVYRKKRISRAHGGYQDVSFGKRKAAEPITLRLEDAGVEMDSDANELAVSDALDLVQSIIQDNPSLAEELLESLEAGEPVVAHTMVESQPPDLVQLTTMILEDTLSHAQIRSGNSTRVQLITSAINVLSALLPLPKYSSRVWLYIRSTTALFGPERKAEFASIALTFERSSGHYTMTLALLQLVQQLFQEATTSLLTTLPGNIRLQQVKEEVLLRAAHFFHAEIWVEHLSWRYAQLGDRFEIGRRIASFYAEVLRHSPPTSADRPFSNLSEVVINHLLINATTSAINPLVSSITSGNSLLKILYGSRRYGDARRLIYLLESTLHLSHVLLNCKQLLPNSPPICLLEQALCSRVASLNVSLLDSRRSNMDPLDVIATYVKERDAGDVVPLESIKLLCCLCISMSAAQPSMSPIIGHFSDPEATVSSFIRIVQHPYDDLSLRNAVWTFISLAVDKEPALASLFVSGKFHNPAPWKGKEKAEEEHKTDSGRGRASSAMDVARTSLSNWRELWEANPQLLASVLHFLQVVWQHALEHSDVLDAIRADDILWLQLAAIISEELGPAPDYNSESHILWDGTRRSNLHEAISVYAYRTSLKASALQIVNLDVGINRQTPGRKESKPRSYRKIEGLFKSEERLTDQILEAASTTYEPSLYDDLMNELKVDFPALSLDHLQHQTSLMEREFGDDYIFSISLLRSRLESIGLGDPTAEERLETIEMRLRSINMNLSLARSQMALAESWQLLLRQTAAFVRSDTAVRPILLSIAASISADLASQTRSGDLMSTIHDRRLLLLLALLEVSWFSTADKPKEIESFITLVNNLHGIILNEPQSPMKSFLGSVSAPFHRTLLQIIYFCARQCRGLARRPKLLHADQRLTVTATVESALAMIITALRLVFDSARGRLDIELDQDMELLVATFEQCTRLEITPSSTAWLTHCQETDVIRASLDLLIRTDLTGLSHIPILQTRKRPLYSPHILLFHVSLASIPSAAERLASEGVLAAYCNNGISSAISPGSLSCVLAELPGERNPAHRAYCSMLAVVAAVINALGRHNHYFDAEASGFVQLYADQISSTLSWTMGDSITFPLLEEIEQTVNIFYALAESRPLASSSNSVVDKVLRAFTKHALHLLQQFNYALTHPNHLASLFEPITGEERAQAEKEPKDSSTYRFDPMKRPLLARLLYRFFSLTNTVLNALISISRADAILIGDQDDWPLQEALIVPHSKVVSGEDASLGTLLELGNCALDLLRELVGRPAAQAVTSEPVTGGMLSVPLDVLQAVATARQTLESALTYAVTQLAMWLSKPEFDNGTGDDANADDLHKGENQRLNGDSMVERRSMRPSLSLAERLRIGMTGEMASDLKTLIEKAKPIIVKSGSMLAPGEVDLTDILLRFLQERIMSAV